jgi:hypothetical protein
MTARRWREGGMRYDIYKQSVLLVQKEVLKLERSCSFITV